MITVNFKTSWNVHLLTLSLEDDSYIVAKIRQTTKALEQKYGWRVENDFAGYDWLFNICK